MNAFEVQDNLNFALLEAKYAFKGKLDRCGCPKDEGQAIWTNQRHNIYKGKFLHNNLHGSGDYQWINYKEKSFFEGRFYCNDINGYGILSYSDGKTFEGLFRRNMRFGPGVLTHPSGKQDIGVWIGSNLVRLSQVVRPESIETLANSSKAKIYLLRFRIVVPIDTNIPDTAQNVLESLDAKDDTLAKKNDLYYSFVRNQKSIFFDRKTYNDHYFGKKQYLTIDVISKDDNGLPVTYKVTAQNLLAWNNDDILVSIMKHTFIHRKFETNITYGITGILAGQRNNFREPDFHEKLCIDYLEACDEGNDVQLCEIIGNNDIYLNLCDSTGNFSVMYAAAKDHTKIIKLLTNFGCNLNQMNDECLTALTHCILRYLAVKNDVKNWEIAFLPNMNQKESYQNQDMWFPHFDGDSGCLISLLSGIDGTDSTLKYVLNLKPPKCPKPTTKVKKSKKASKKGKLKINLDTAQIEKENAMTEKLKVIFNTILLLLRLNANPNIGEVPYPPLILSLFTNNYDLVSTLIKFKADINVRTHKYEGALTPLHVLASLPPQPELIPLVNLLIDSGADVNAKTNQYHWKKEKLAILAGTECEDNGKSPCNLLCMRWDFVKDENDILGKLCQVFMERGADFEQKYLGHTPLSLAILKGNIRLITNILETEKIDPNQTLGNNMGVPLTVLILKRYKKILPIDVGMKVYDVLVKYNANPLNIVSGYDTNCVEFAFEENGLIEKEPETTGKKKDKKKKKRKINMKDKHIQLLFHLQKRTRDTLVRHIQGKIVKPLYTSAEFKEDDYDIDGLSKVISFLSIEETSSVLKILLENHQITPNQNRMKRLLEIVQRRATLAVHSKKAKKDKHKEDKKLKGKSKEGDNKLNIDDLVKSLHENYPKRAKRPKVTPVEIDKHEEKYVVCYECLQKKNKTLIKCPNCELVYFCSQTCNNKNIQDKNTRHACKDKFYDTQLKCNEFETRRKILLEKGSKIKFDKLYGDYDLDGKKSKDKSKLGKKKDASESDKETNTRSRKTRKDTNDKSKKSKSKDRDTSGSKDRKKSARSPKDDSDRDKSKDKRDKSKNKHDHKRDGKSKSPSPRDKRKESPINKNKGQGDKRGKSKESAKVLQKDTSKGRGQIKDKTDGYGGMKDKIEKDNQGDNLRDTRTLNGQDNIEEDGDSVGLPCECQDALLKLFGDTDAKLLKEIFLPYCVFVNGELYYRFGGLHEFFKLTYSDV